MSEPWKNWLLGVLSKEQVRKLCEEGYLRGIERWNKGSNKNPIGHSAIDLTLTDKAYVMEEGPVKPFGDRYLRQICQLTA